MASEIIYYGTIAKITVELDPIGDITMDDFDFKCIFTAGEKSVVIPKNEMVKVDSSHYDAYVDTTKLNPGLLSVVVSADLIDPSAPGGIRREICSIPTKLNIVKLKINYGLLNGEDNQPAEPVG